MIEIEQYIYGMTDDGDAIVIYSMTSENGAVAEVCNLGATIFSVKVPDRHGKIGDVVLGYSTLENMLRDRAYAGRTVGRVANRIADGRVTIEGKEYYLDLNSGNNHLHGGTKGIGTRIWESRVETNRVVMTLRSEDGDQGYPGTLDIEAVFDFDGESLELTYRAVSDQTTIVNITNHVYFNLGAEQSTSVLGHELKFCSSRVLETQPSKIPTGRSLHVAGTSLDFSEFRALGEAIDSDFNATRELRGVDHFFEVDGYRPAILAENAQLRDPESGRMMSVYSSAPGVQVYTGNYLAASSPISKSGERFVDHQGVALECQIHPNAINEPHFPSIEFKAGEIFCQKIVYKFTTF